MTMVFVFVKKLSVGGPPDPTHPSSTWGILYTAEGAQSHNDCEGSRKILTPLIPATSPSTPSTETTGCAQLKEVKKP